MDGPHIPRKWKAEDETGSKKEGRALNGIKVEAVVKGDSIIIFISHVHLFNIFNCEIHHFYKLF